jgi:hypothetical protein
VIVKVKSRGRNVTGRSRARDRWSRNAKPDVPVNAVPVNAVPVKGAGLRLVGFGKHKGKRYADVPLGYLRWMIREKCQAWKNARAEVERRRWSAREVLGA